MTMYHVEVSTSENRVNKWMEVRLASRKAVIRLAIHHAHPDIARVLDASGVQAELVRHLEHFQSKYPKVERITNQTHRVEEIKAMYKAGFRCKDAERLSLFETINLARNDGEPLVWERK